jgi:pyridoxine 5-phosphate synthase
MAKLCVNIDHVATLRQARRTVEPDPVYACAICELAGCDGITIHLREDRRHINDRDVRLIRQVVRTKLNLEMSISEDIVKVACDVVPHQSTLVPEKREEITTEGGLDVVSYEKEIKKVTQSLRQKGIVVSLFVDPEEKQIEVSKRTGAEFVELHTGRYANAGTEAQAEQELEKLIDAARFAKTIGLRVNAGHGLTYLNVTKVARIPGVEELNIGHSIIARAVLAGLDKAVREMILLVKAE